MWLLILTTVHAKLPLLLSAPFFLHCIHLFLTHGHNAQQDADSLLTEALDHVHEHVKALTFVLLQRVFLTISAKADAIPEVIHVKEVILPQPVKHLQHDKAFGACHLLRTEKFNLLFICLVKEPVQFLLKLFHSEVLTLFF